ncbi:hypothetical protein HPB47_018461 [Ixodes persulcatus]|uniref:Uncharacterized protein n=1 Tax=Ixodes persulcatus TaxID=34615 RepID=A0AC60QLI1_IXOPE|nr:hypothetical protein HPB47_018461 [Ixodes persulcatus]
MAAANLVGGVESGHLWSPAVFSREETRACIAIINVMKATARDCALADGDVDTQKRLTDEKLLAHCIRRKTQNSAETLNSKIWLLCPNTRFASRTLVETATALSVLRSSECFRLKELSRLGTSVTYESGECLPEKQQRHLLIAAA